MAITTHFCAIYKGFTLKLSILLFLIAALMVQTSYAQLRIYYNRGGGMENEKDCRMTKEDLKPLIGLKNPYFYNHFWNDEEKREVAQLSADRLVVIEQGGCTRHHIYLELTVTGEAAEINNPNFYINETYGLFNKLFYNDLDYYLYREEFEDKLVAHVAKNGVKGQFNFIVNDFTFIFQLSGTKDNAKINIEFVKYIHIEDIVQPGIKEYLDDAYFINPSK